MRRQYTGGQFEGGNFYADDAAYERARRYNRVREWLTLAGMVWSALLSVAALVTGLSAWLRDRARRAAPRGLGPVMPYTAAVSLLSFLASLPLSYLGGRLVERRFGLSNQGGRAWLVDQLKGLAIGLALGAPLAQGVYWIIRRYPRSWWAIFSAVMVPLSVVLDALAPVLILPLFNTFEPLRDRALGERMKRLAAAQGVEVADVLQMDMSRQTKKANAFFTGLGRTKRIVLGDTLLDAFTPDEVEIVVAHELGHQVRRDLWKGIGVGTLATVATTYTLGRLAPPLLARIGRRAGLDPERGVGDVAALPALALLVSAVSLVLSPLQNAWSRRVVEHAADRYALELTRDPDAFASAMEKLGRMNLADPAPPALVKYLLYSHPPIAERIAYARRFKAAIDGVAGKPGA
jgi:STE24 endopeptidase